MLIGLVEQSIRTHLRKGRYKHIDPSLYDIWTESANLGKNRALLYMSRKA